ncbi:MAG: hypothetical protein QM783_04510 [Phycisphaerales bacterium]
MQRTDSTARKLSRPSFFFKGEALMFAAMLAIGGVSAVVIKELTTRETGPCWPRSMVPPPSPPAPPARWRLSL